MNGMNANAFATTQQEYGSAVTACDEAAIYIAIGKPTLAIRSLRNAVKRRDDDSANALRRLREIETMYPTTARRVDDEDRRDRRQSLLKWISVGAAVALTVFALGALGAVLRGVSLFEPRSHWTEIAQLDDALRGMTFMIGMPAGAAVLLLVGYIGFVCSCKLAQLGSAAERIARRLFDGNTSSEQEKV